MIFAIRSKSAFRARLNKLQLQKLADKMTEGSTCERHVLVRVLFCIEIERLLIAVFV